MAHAVAHADLAVDGERVVLRWPGDGLGTVGGAVGDAVSQAAYDLLTGDHLARVKVCAGCHWVFLDQSKNGSRRWCSMEDCGTSAKMRRYVARRAARRASAAAPGH